MPTDDTFHTLMARLRSGEDAAAREVFDRFTGRLVALARGQFNQLVARKVDPEDVVQSAYKSFFVRHRAGKIEIGDWGGLWNMLTLITLRKCADRADLARARARREALRDLPGSPAVRAHCEALDLDPSLPPDPELLALDREPRPEEAVILAETVERLFRDVSAHERPVLELSLQGYSVEEICTQLSRAERSVRRLRERVRKRLERLQAAD
jgi:RNA polymerase sigma-70 factor (ECF subfamily)